MRATIVLILSVLMQYWMSLNRFKTDSGTNKFWVESLSGTQVDNIQFKTIQSINDFESVLLSITPQDVQLLIDLLKFNNEDRIFYMYNRKYL
jgi:hypothetical protein